MTAFEQSADAGRSKAHASLAALAKRSKIAQCLEMQEELRLAIIDPLFPRDKKASLVVAWDRLEDRIRILRDKPLPGSLTHEKIKRVRGQRSLRSGMSMLNVDGAELDELGAGPGPGPHGDHNDQAPSVS